MSLFWVVYEDELQRQVINSTSAISELELKKEFLHQARRRGLPVVFPLMDLEDSMLISTSDIWGRFVEPVTAASARYGSKAVVAGRLLESGGQWQGRFLLLLGDEQLSADFEADDSAKVIAQLIDWTGERLCDVYCVQEQRTAATSEQVTWQLLVTDVGSFSSYRKLMDYLAQLSAIRKAEVAEVRGRQLLISVDLVGDVGSLVQAIELDNKMIPVEDNKALANGQLEQNLLIYQWRP